MGTRILQRFLDEEYAPSVRALVHIRLEAGWSGEGPRQWCFESNGFGLTFDLDRDTVLIEDALDDAEDRTELLPIETFFAALWAQRPVPGEARDEGGQAAISP